jgi:putative aldouronate transport system substrate-binding protein
LYGNQALLYIYEGGNPDAPKILDEFNQTAVKSPVLGFTYNPEKMKTEIAAISNVVAEFSPGLSSGAVDKDGLYDKFLAKLKAAGVDKLIADKQSQLDEWLKQQGN